MSSLGFWDRAYRDDQHRQHWQPPAGVSPELVDFLAKSNWPPKARVLDLGCGTGLDLDQVERHGLWGVGVDTSLVGLGLGRIDQSGRRLARASTFALPFADLTFELCLDRGLLHLLDDDDRPDLFAEIYRILKSGGLYFVRGAALDEEDEGLIGLPTEALGFKVVENELGTMESESGSLAARFLILRREAC